MTTYNNVDLIKMFLAGVDWERTKGKKPKIKDAAIAAINAIRAQADAPAKNTPATPPKKKK